ncbi:hypothetical protein V6N13_085004 [Hibiscus sabdariffa]|uniref:Uncharacterized protein n=1 Tax=Hibiscus sabdariffa TaxID=183260 RepID=A0ABR2D091_9ROSI
MTNKRTPISTNQPPKEQPNVKKRAIGEAHPEKTTTGLKEMERKKREAVNPSIKRTCSKGDQTKHNPKTEE